MWGVGVGPAPRRLRSLAGTGSRGLDSPGCAHPALAAVSRARRPVPRPFFGWLCQTAGAGLIAVICPLAAAMALGVLSPGSVKSCSSSPRSSSALMLCGCSCGEGALPEGRGRESPHGE